MSLSSYDRAHIHEILLDEEGVKYDWFSAHVIRFIGTVWHKADSTNRAILRLAFPDAVEAFENYLVAPISDEYFDELMKGQHE